MISFLLLLVVSQVRSAWVFTPTSSLGIYSKKVGETLNVSVEVSNDESLWKVELSAGIVNSTLVCENFICESSLDVSMTNESIIFNVTAQAYGYYALVANNTEIQIETIMKNPKTFTIRCPTEGDNDDELYYYTESAEIDTTAHADVNPNRSSEKRKSAHSEISHYVRGAQQASIILLALALIALIVVIVVTVVVVRYSLKQGIYRVSRRHNVI